MQQNFPESEADDCKIGGLENDLHSQIFHDMKAQSLIQLHEWEPAVHSSLHAVHESARIWAPAFQTLGRAYLGKGLVCQATATFSKAFHLDPSDSEVLSDLNWASRFGHSHFFVLFWFYG